jgi:hypothetical protein
MRKDVLLLRWGSGSWSALISTVHGKSSMADAD